MTDEQRALLEELIDLAGDPARDGGSPPDKWALLARGLLALRGEMDVRLARLEGVPDGLTYVPPEKVSRV